MHAILSKSEVMAALFMDYSVSLRAIDIQWGWTALHCAAHVGMDNVTKSLLGKRASPYTTSKVRTSTGHGRLLLSTPDARKQGYSCRKVGTKPVAMYVRVDFVCSSARSAVRGGAREERLPKVHDQAGP